MIQTDLRKRGQEILLDQVVSDNNDEGDNGDFCDMHTWMGFKLFD